MLLKFTYVLVLIIAVYIACDKSYQKEKLVTKSKDFAQEVVSYCEHTANKFVK